MASVRVIIVDDFEPFRRSFRRFLESDTRVQVVAEGENFGDAVKLISEVRPDMAILDLKMPAPSNFRLDQIAAVSASANCSVLATSVWNDDEAEQIARAMGAVARFDKAALPETLLPRMFEIIQSRRNSSAPDSASNPDAA
jgi:DNA-binding NarL/FixJ family response regulator